ncbi:MAG: dihydroorotase [Lachnospiraceae bacterium]|nr:dihydroorotase [Lachnospiraceae bacterium]
MKLRIRGGHVIDPANEIDEIKDLLSVDGVITDREEDLDGSERVIEAEGLVVCPGFIDVHAHFRDPGQTEKETLLTGSAAAAAGGYSTVLLMANTVPPVDTVPIWEDIMKRGERSPVRILQAAAVTLGRQGKELADLKALHRAGVRVFTDDGSPLADDALAEKAMEQAALLGVILSFHEEHPDFVKDAGVNAGYAAKKLGLEGAHRQAEICLVERDLRLALSTGAVIDIQHVSTKEAVELIRRAKKKDSKGIIHAEAAPHHFSLTEEALGDHGTNAKVNPPLRTEADRLAIIEGLRDGTIDLIATDHAPHTAGEKNKGFREAPSGMIGLQTALSLGIMQLVKPGFISMAGLIRLMSSNPALFYGLDSGRLDPGRPADITIFDPEEEWCFDRGTNCSKSENSPLFGQVLTGRVRHTIIGGKEVYPA